jgi:phosphoribosyl 1,2-cyclic phosphodiesterase
MATTLHWLGNGSGLNLALNNTSFYLKGAGPRLALVDCGFTVPARLDALGILGQVTDIVITHLHADHVGGLETLASIVYYAMRRRGPELPTLHLATDDLARQLWENSLRAGMANGSDDNNQPIDAALTTYFHVRTGPKVDIDGLPGAVFLPTRHIPNMPNYSLRFDNGVYYSADCRDMPPFDAKLIFQDVHFQPPFDEEVHASYLRLRDEMPAAAKKKTWLVHLGNGHEKFSPEKDGFAGYVEQDQEFLV